MILLLAQAMGIIGWLLLIYSYYKEDIEELLFIQILSSVFYCANYFLLGAFSGLAICIFELFKMLSYYKTDKDELIFLFSLPVYGLIAYFSYGGIGTLLPIIASIIDGFTLAKNKNIATIGGAISNFLWVLYDISILAYSVALTDAVLVVSNLMLLIVGYSTLLKIDKFRMIKCTYYSRNIGKSLYNLDKQTYGEDYLWDERKQKKIYDKNEDSLLLIKYQNKIVGYVNYLVVDELYFETLKDSNKFYNNVDINNITKFKKSKKNYLLIESINVLKKYQNYKTIKLINSRLKRLLKEKYKKGYKIKDLISFTVNSFEEECLENFGFEKIKTFNEIESCYYLDEKKLIELHIGKRSKLEKEKYKVVINQNMSKYIESINELDSEFYKKAYLWEKEYQEKIFKKNPISIIGVTYNGELIGYLNYLVITENKYKKIKKSDTIIDEYELEDIVKFRKTYKNYITINSVVINRKFQNGYAIKLLTKKLKRELRKINQNGYKIKGITTTAVSKDGRKLAEQIGFIKLKKLSDNTTLYIMEDNNLKEYLE